MRLTRAQLVLVPLAGSVLLLTGCVASSSPRSTGAGAAAPSSPTGSSAASAESSASPDCSPASMKTLTAGKLTFATDEPVYEPWFVDDKPQNGKGYEGAVAAAVAAKLGYAPGDVVWTRVKFDNVIQPGPKKFDADVNEFSITEARKKAVDFSSSYYDVTQAVVTTAKSKAAKATTLADLKSLKIGAQVGTTSYDAIVNQIAPGAKPGVYNTNDEAVRGLENGQVDAIVVDLPTAFYITSAQLKDGKIVGQLVAAGGTPEQFGMVLDKGSSLTSCVSGAVDALRDDGTLRKLQDQWLAQTVGAPVLS